ncbi:dihydroneopterin aldolase [Microaerobacter geothermalis]|uniref:dihydroneopterin aldolase n=1 Tax=Microaerobacter geothermalis TaxID=674972 RepID=UPI001F26A000|nr:dihydroneopterin aldolase [Microaerobacter geothermalis]MCF6094674.1 dihydroneopterin aldolase [Microaerobacter geothermalis]
MDQIHLRGLQFFAYHGVFPEENKLGQRYIINLTLSLDLSKAGKSDDLSETVNYAEIYHVVEDIVKGETYQLIESLAERIAQKLLFHYPIENVDVEVIKPNPPIDGNLDYISVQIRRGHETV